MTIASTAEVVTIVFPGDSQSLSDWSGSPAGLAQGLERLGVDVRHVSAAAPRRVRGILRRLPTNHVHESAVQTAVARWRLARAGKVGTVIQIGTDFSVPSRYPTFTYEDMTVVQHEQLADEWFMSHTAKERTAWVRRQRRSYGRARGCLVGSAFAAASVVGDYDVPEAKVSVVGFGNNIAFPHATDRDWTTPRYLVVARDWKRKNVPAVLEAFRALRADLPDARLDIVGDYPGEDEPGVVVHGRLRLDEPAERGRLEQLFGEATCFVMPSTHEAFGIAYVEAAAAGIPSIGTTVGGAADAIGDGGVLVDPDEDGAIERAMRHFADPEAAQRVAALALAHAEGCTWDAVAQRVLDAIHARRADRVGRPMHRRGRAPWRSRKIA